MMQEVDNEKEAAALKAIITEFINNRKFEKLKKEKDDVKKEKIESNHIYENWIGNAAKKAHQIQFVTHVQKFIHSKIDIPSILFNSLENFDIIKSRLQFIGTHTVARVLENDTTGNAGALDVGQFLKQKYNEKSLLDYILTKPNVVKNAFSDKQELANSWINSFKQTIKIQENILSHTLAKQLYFPVGNNKYHIISPVFPSSFVNVVHNLMREDIFSEKAKEAREAKRNNNYHATKVIEYPNLVYQTFGGSNPQGVSEFNLGRRGKNWLLCSVPPIWNSKQIKPPYYTSSVFDYCFTNRFKVKSLVKELGLFLSKECKNNYAIRNKRADFIGKIIDEIFVFTYEMHSLEPCWSDNEECTLLYSEILWLDPKRSLTNAEFKSDYDKQEWQTAVSSNFAKWLNAKLRDTYELDVGDNEYLAWKKELETEISMIRWDYE